jgi:hypothetical protein
MRITTISVAALMIALVLSASNAVAKNEVYRWVDENGVVHFGDRPDGQTNAEQVDIQKSPSSSLSSSSPVSTNTDQQPSYADQLRDERAEKRRAAAGQQQAIAAGCVQRRQLVAQLEPSTRVMVEHEDGTVTRMDDNERLETLGEAKAYIAEKCVK